MKSFCEILFQRRHAIPSLHRQVDPTFYTGRQPWEISLFSDLCNHASTFYGLQPNLCVRQLMFDEFFFLTTGLPQYYPDLESKAKRKTSKKRRQKQLKEKKGLQAELDAFWFQRRATDVFGTRGFRVLEPTDLASLPGRFSRHLPPLGFPSS